MDELLKNLNSIDETDRVYAVDDLAELGDPKAVSSLLKRLNVESSEIVENAIVAALKQLDCSGSYDYIFELLSSPEAFIRNAALGIFASEGERAIAFLTSYLDHSNREIRKLILDSLVEIGTNNALFAIRACLFDKDPNVQITAVEYITKLEDKDSLEDMLEIFSENPEPMLKTTLLYGITTLGDENTLRKVLNILLKEGLDKSNFDSTFIDDLFDLISKVGNFEELTKVFDMIDDTFTYEENIIETLEAVKNRFNDFLNSTKIMERLIDIVKNNKSGTSHRYNAVEFLIDDNCSIISADVLYELGLKLAEQKNGLLYSAVKLLVKSKKDDVKEKIMIIKKSSNDDALIEFCTNILLEEVK